MTHPYPDMPSLKQFVENAVLQGCEEADAIKLFGPRGPTKTRYLVVPGEPGQWADLPNIDEDELISPEKLAHLVRILGVGGYEESLEKYGYNADGTPKISNI